LGFAAAISDGRLDVLLEPVVGLGDLRPRHYEVSLRLTDENGNAVDARPGDPQLASSGLLPLLDRARLDRTANVAGRLDKRGKTGVVLSEYSRESLTDREFLLSAKACSDQYPGITGQLVLSFSQNSLRSLNETQWAALAALKSIGFRFAVQDIADLDMDFGPLAAVGFAFAKLDADVFLEGLRSQQGIVPANDISRYFANLGLTLIVGRIDDESERARLFGFGAHFGQGQLFGGARPMKVDSIARTEHRAA
jgi:cyclic-di-GMP phosphodiesterase TipF (flagellum assembly factor)